MLTSHKQCPVQPLGGIQGYVVHYTRVGVFQRGTEFQVAGDVKGTILIHDDGISTDVCRNPLVLGNIVGPLLPCYVNGFWVEPKGLTHKVHVITSPRGLFHKHSAGWCSYQGREVTQLSSALITLFFSHIKLTGLCHTYTLASLSHSQGRPKIWNH